jgi:superfamily I DNA/RNA helicase
MKQRSKLILGGPGAGKTRRLMEIMQEELARGVQPSEIAFVSFTKKAVREAAERAAGAFGLGPDAFPFCQTIHSLGYREMGAGHVMDKEQWREFGEIVSCDFQDIREPDVFSKKAGDKARALIDYARNTMSELKSVWHRRGECIPWLWLEWFWKEYRRYKETRFVMDYPDMLTRYAQSGDPVPVEVAIIDEAQDLSRLQWQVVRRAFKNAARIYIAGDDSQAIFSWSGADVETFLNLKVDDMENLALSYRLVPDVLEYSQTVIKRVRCRYNKKFGPTKTGGGRVRRYPHPYLSTIPVEQPGSWLFLARTRALLKDFTELLQAAGLLFTTKSGKAVKPRDLAAIENFEALRRGKTVKGPAANNVLRKAGKSPRFVATDRVTFPDLKLCDDFWYKVLKGIPRPERSYYRTALRKGEDLRAKPRIHLDTIHSQKGGEADQVAIMSDMGRLPYQHFQMSPDDEWRVWYVGITRTKGDLHIVGPESQRYYPA